MAILTKLRAYRPCLLLAAVAALALSMAHANGPCSLPMNARRKGSAGCAASTAGNGASGGYPSPPSYFGVTAARMRHNTPVLSFRQPKESLVRLKELGGKVKGKVGQTLEGLKQKWDMRRSNKKTKNNGNVTGGKKAKENASITHVRVERSLFRCAPVSLPQTDREVDEECPAGQDTVHHPHQQFQGEKQMEMSPPCSSPGDAAFDDDSALFVLGRTQSFDTALLHDAEARSRRCRGAVSYGNRLMNFVGFTFKLLTLLLFQVLGTALVVNEYQTTGVVSETLMKFASLLAGLAFVPPLVVALRESLPSHARNPLVRGFSCLFELALDTVAVGALSLLASVLLTAVMSLPSYNFLLSHELGEEYIKGALSAGFVMFFVWAFSRNFEPLASKWFL